MAKKLFSIGVTETSYGFVEVEADTKEEALERAKAEYEDGNVFWNNSEEEYEIDSSNEI